ncbi:MAG: alpha/beta hydrolase [Oceanospirillaceae bacterium]|nr:alpha/beta hydrolase [Oceanospirillaceae bacterium]
MNDQERSAATLESRDYSTGPFVNPRVSWRARLLNRALQTFVKRRMHNLPEIPALRRFMLKTDARLAAPVSGDIDVQTMKVSGVPCHSLTRRQSSSRTLLYLHGGGFCAHTPKTYNGFAARLCDAFEANALLPDYRLAPEHPYPAAIDDCFAVYRYLLDQGTDPGRIVVAGDSAGGCLALALMMRLRREGLPMPGCVVAMSPATDHPDNSPDLEAATRNDPMFSPEVLHLFASSYVPRPEDRTNPEALPLNGEYEGLPPLQIHVGSTEALLSHSARAAAKATAAGVEVSLNVWDSMPHVHPIFHLIPESGQAIDMMATFVRRHLP